MIDNLTPIEREAQDRDGHWHLLRIRPYRTRENKIDGAVILLVDIDEMRRVVDVLISSTTQPLLILGIDAKIRKANDAFCNFFGVKAEDLSEKSLYEAGNGQWNLPELQKVIENTSRDNKPSETVEFQTAFPRAGLRRLRVTSRRFSQESRGMQLLLLSFEEISGNNG